MFTFVHGLNPIQDTEVDSKWCAIITAVSMDDEISRVEELEAKQFDDIYNFVDGV